MGTLKNIFLSFLLAFLILLNKEAAFSSPRNEMLCHKWLGKLHGNNGQKSCKEVHNNKEGIKSCSRPEPHYHDGDSKNVIYEISDNIGVLGVCRDYFPTWGEREFFYRESSDPFNINLVVMRQYCWARFILDHTTNCGAPKYKFPFSFTWDHGGAYAAWGDTKKKTFKLNEIGKNHAKTIFWGSNYAYIDYDAMRDKDGNVVKDKNGEEKKDPRRVCAYYTPTFVASWLTDTKVIGCVDVPLKPGPPIFNKILVPQKTVAVSSKKPDNNTFEGPKINLTVLDATGKDIGPTVTLTYDFSKIDTKQQCKYLLGEEFCPTFSSTDPSRICAKRKDNGNVIGCIDRKTLAESAIKIKVEHDYVIDNDCNIDPKKPSVFQSLRIKLIKPDGSSKVYPSSNIPAIREYYACTKRITNPKTGKITGMTFSGFDSVDVLGVKFNAIIPKFQKEDPKEFEKINLRPPQILESYPNEFEKSCENCFVTSLETDGGVPYIVPAGKRDRSSCQKNYKCINLNDPPKDNDPPKEEKCTFGYNNSYNDAEKAYCSGVYVGADDSSSTQDKICLRLDTDWENFFGPHDDMDNLCVDIPQSYLKLGKDDISAITGYADFSNDGYDPGKTYPKDKKFYGECHASLGLEYTEEIMDNITKIEDLNDYQMLDLKSKYGVLKRKMTQINANAPLITKELLKLLGFKSKKFKGDPRTVYTKRPYRTLDGNFPIGNIHNPCKFIQGKDGCTNSKDTRDFSGNADYTPEKKLKIGHSLKLETDIVKKVTDYNTGMATTDLPILGKCRSGFSSSSTPSRICRIITNKDDKIVSKAWTNLQVIDPCLKSSN